MLHAARICSLQLNKAEATTCGSITDVAVVWRSMHSNSGRVPSSTPERSWHPLLLSGGPPICKFHPTEREPTFFVRRTHGFDEEQMIRCCSQGMINSTVAELRSVRIIIAP